MVSEVEKPVEELLQCTFEKQKGEQGMVVGDWSWCLETARRSCESAKKRTKDNRKDKISVTPAGQLILSVRLDPRVPSLPPPPPLLLQVHHSSRHDCTAAAMSTCLSASITVDNAPSGEKQDPGHRRASQKGASGQWLVRPQTRPTTTTLIVASAANGHLINTPAPGALMTHRSKCVKDQINNGHE